MKKWYVANRNLRIGSGISRGEVFEARPGAGYLHLVRDGSVTRVYPEDVLPPEDVLSPEDKEQYVGFASDAAEQAAADGGLVAADFEGRVPSGQEGRFTKADVEALVRAKAEVV